MDDKTKQTIFKLKQVVKLLQSIKKEDDLTEEDLSVLGTAVSYFGEDYHFKNYRGFLKNLPISAVTDEIKKLEEPTEEKEEEKEDKEETSIPPELESLVAEYRENQALLEEEEIKSNRQRSVAEQVKIAIAHRKIVEQVQANKQRRQESGEKFTSVDEALVKLGSPKSESAAAALASSFDVVKQVAFTYSGFSKLPPEVQNQIITAAVDLNTVGVTDIDTAIQASTLQLDTTKLDDTSKKNLATIPGGFVSNVYHEIVKSNDITLQNEAKITANEVKILELGKQGKATEVQTLIEENQHLIAYNENQSVRLVNTISKQTETFKDFEKSRQTRLSKDPDLQDYIEKANKNISSIQNSLTTNNVTPHLFTPLDDAQLLENAIRHDMPGELRPHAGYEAEYAAALVNHPKTQSQELSPQAILLYGKELTPTLLAKVRKFATDNPDSALGKLIKTREDIFNAAGSQLRKIASSPLGKEITVVKKGLSKVFDGVSKFVGKISDKIPGGFGTILSFVQDPWGTLRSWAGRKAGEFIVRRLAESLGNEALKQGAEYLLKNGLKESVKKLAQQAAAKAAAKIAATTAAKTGAKVALEAGAQAANVVPGLGILIAIAIEVVFWIGEKIFGAIKKATVAIYGEEIKARDFLVLPVMGATSVVSGIGAFFATLASATAAAASSAIIIFVISAIVGYFFYITSFVTAPLLSTLVQLESTSSASLKDCNNTTLTNDKKECNGDYCFPVNDISTVSYATYHHDYYANDIMRIGDSPGPADDVPLPLLAYTSGQVIWTSENDGLGGYSFIIAGNDGMFYYYAHNMCNLVSEGQTVTSGEVVGGMDSSGNASGTPEHLHFQIADQADMTTVPENYPHFFPPWEDFCAKLNMCGPLNPNQNPEL